MARDLTQIDRCITVGAIKAGTACIHTSAWANGRKSTVLRSAGSAAGKPLIRFKARDAQIFSRDCVDVLVGELRCFCGEPASIRCESEKIVTFLLQGNEYFCYELVSPDPFHRCRMIHGHFVELINSETNLC